MNIDMSRKIHEQITVDNWTRGPGSRRRGCCTILWVYQRYTDVAERIVLYSRVVDWLGIVVENVDHHAYEIIVWNDAPERTFDDVYNLLKQLDI